jgi:hypothetical protein
MLNGPIRELGKRLMLITLAPCDRLGSFIVGPHIIFVPSHSPPCEQQLWALLRLSAESSGNNVGSIGDYRSSYR